MSPVDKAGWRTLYYLRTFSIVTSNVKKKILQSLTNPYQDTYSLELWYSDSLKSCDLYGTVFNAELTCVEVNPNPPFPAILHKCKLAVYFSQKKNKQTLLNSKIFLIFQNI